MQKWITINKFLMPFYFWLFCTPISINNEKIIWQFEENMSKRFTFRWPCFFQVDDNQHGDELFRQQGVDLRRHVTHESRQESVTLQVVGVQRVRDAQLGLVGPKLKQKWVSWQ